LEREGLISVVLASDSARFGRRNKNGKAGASVLFLHELFGEGISPWKQDYKPCVRSPSIEGGARRLPPMKQTSLRPR